MRRVYWFWGTLLVDGCSNSGELWGKQERGLHYAALIVQDGERPMAMPPVCLPQPDGQQGKSERVFYGQACASCSRFLLAFLGSNGKHCQRTGGSLSTRVTISPY